MFKKIELWIVILLLIFWILITLLFGGILRDAYLNINKTPEKFRQTSVFLSEIPKTIYKIFTIYFDINRPPKLLKNIDKPKFERFINENREALLVLPRYDGDLNRSIVEIIDLNNFEIIHTYKHDIDKMNEFIDTSNVENSRVKIDHSKIRFQYRHPLILQDGSLISDGDYAPLFKIDFCSDLIWINQEERFHHSIEIDENQKNIWTGAQLFPYSKIVEKVHLNKFGFNDDAIANLNTDGNILFIKSIIEILVENEILDEIIFVQSEDPIHLNDIQPANKTTKYWKKGDLFISIPKQYAVMHYRPSNNEVINYIKGPFYSQHDVDIISDKEISIFNNNNSFINENEYSEVLIYNFETKKFKKKFNQSLISDNFKTQSQGLSEILKDGSMLVEEQNYGRLIFYNKYGDKEWEYVNKDKNGDIFYISWSRVIEDIQFIQKFKSLVESKKCSN